MKDIVISNKSNNVQQQKVCWGVEPDDMEATEI